MNMPPLGRMLITAGIVLLIAGLLVTLGGRLGLGKLPGDFLFRRGNATFYFPLATSIIISLLLTLLLNLFLRR
ncbi:MAG: DUF2905 family protein [Bacillota bacterium]|nr:DUF2905 family protein [Bacillota bacterium]